MRYVRFALLALALAAMGVSAQTTEKPKAEAKAKAAEPAEQTMTVEGEAVDMKCYLSMDMPGGGKHNECAVKCAKMGIPVGVVDAKTGKTYAVVAPAAGLADVLGKTVRITGTHHAKSMALIPDKIEVKEGDKWTEFKIPEGMM